MFTEFKKKDQLNLSGKKKKNVDHILVRDYIREVDIGAFQSEYGNKQRVSFNIILEVNSDVLPMHDNVDLVLSYDNIIEIIEEEICSKRVALLETLAEYIAFSCLCLKSVITATVRLEKLDKGLGKLGVQISRTRGDANSSQTGWEMINKGNLILKNRIPNTGLLFISNKMLLPENIHFVEKFVSDQKVSWVICLSEIFTEFSAMDPRANIEILKMAIAQNAYRLNQKYNNWKLSRSKTEIVFLLKQGINSIWCPSNIYQFSKGDLFLDREFGLNMACHLTKDLLMKEIYLFQKEKLSDVVEKKIKEKGLTIQYCPR